MPQSTLASLAKQPPVPEITVNEDNGLEGRRDDVWATQPLSRLDAKTIASPP